jgi:hypothetical protein
LSDREDRENQERLAGIATATEDLAPEASLGDEVVLTAAREATSQIDAAGDVTDAVMLSIELDELGRRTDALAPSDAFTDAVLASAEAEAPPATELLQSSRWPSRTLIRSSRAALFAAAAVAAVSVGYATYVENRIDTDVLSSVAAVELDE